MFSLLNRGVIPKDVDLTPAFERGNAPLSTAKAAITLQEPKLPPQLTQRPAQPTKRMLENLQKMQQITANQVV
jgi:hypothetical protein